MSKEYPVASVSPFIIRNCQNSIPKKSIHWCIEIDGFDEIKPLQSILVPIDLLNH